MSGNKQNVNRIPQDELAMRSILKDMGVTGTVKELEIVLIVSSYFIHIHFSCKAQVLTHPF